MIYPKSKVTVTALTVTTEITEEDEGDPRLLEVRLHDDEATRLITITDKNKDDSSVAFFVEQWAALRGAVDQLAGCARAHDEVMGKPRESSDGGLEMALAQASEMIERMNRERSQIRHGLQGLVDYLGEAELANAHQAPRAAAVVALRHAFNSAATILKAMHESEARSAK